MAFPKSSAFHEDHPAQRKVRAYPEAARKGSGPQPGLSEVPTAVLEEWAGRVRETTSGRITSFHLDGLDQMADEIESYLPG